ncbi:MAG: hypothetical protein GX154_09815 [Clostridiales bacterium]|nr:hypothetical protein [Clostridiales bacterium]
MRRLGKIKWFGTYNSKTDSFNDYGFIQDKKGSIYFNKKSVLSKGKSLDSGVWVTYNKRENREGRFFAEDVLVLENEVDFQVFLDYFQDSWEGISEDPYLSKAFFRYILKYDLKLTEQSIMRNTRHLYPDDQKALVKALYRNPKSIRIMRKFLTDSWFLNYLIENRDNLYKTEGVYYISCLREVLIKLKEEKYWEKLYDSEIIFKSDIWEIAPSVVKVKILTRQNINTLYNNEITRKNIEHIYYIITSADDKEKTELLGLLPEHLKFEPEIYSLLRPIDKLEMLLSNSEFYKKELDLEQEILMNFPLISEKEKYEIAGYLPEKLKMNSLIISYIPPVEQVNILSSMNRDTIEKYWGLCSKKVKTMFIFRNFDNVGYLKDITTEKYIKHLIDMTIAKDKNKAFVLMHSELQNDIVEQAWNLESELDYKPLLPKCNNRYAVYCEGRPWEDKAYCPRTGRACRLDNDSSNNGFYYTQGAKIYPDISLDWTHWSMIEFLSALNVSPRLPELFNSNEYTNRVAGWLNRLIEIRERLKCNVCGKPLKSNMEYSKNLARYNSTVFYCPDNHGGQIYISHCWSCHKIIDSRECQHRDEGGFYVCTNCGSGSKALTVIRD